jgi:hypothetical protein
MDPLAYDLRDHPVFDGPFKIDRTRTVTIPTPPDFKAELKERTIQVLPLVDDTAAQWKPGWCTYAFDFADYPDIEFFSGGVNHKTPTAAGLWRQGNLLHFGFEQSPAEMNETGRHLLLNSIAYISRFSEDRPIAVTPSVFAGKVAPSRRTIIRRFRHPEYEVKWVAESLAPEVRRQVEGKSREECVAWAEANAKFLRPGADTLLTFDEELRALNVAFDQPEFLDAVAGQLRGTAAEQSRGRLLVERYLPDVRRPKAEAVRAWLEENRPYVFASDAGDYRWYVDPLAKRRGVPTAGLRGPRRADLPVPIKDVRVSDGQRTQP